MFTYLIPVLISDSNDASCSDDILKKLQELYHQLSRLPPSPQHGDICNMLAMCYLDRDPRQAAFYLCDGLAVTFRHQLMLNLARKVR